MFDKERLHTTLGLALWLLDVVSINSSNAFQLLFQLDRTLFNLCK